jgi:hypothetical protein
MHTDGVIKITKHNFDINAFSTADEQARLGLKVEETITKSSNSDIEDQNETPKQQQQPKLFGIISENQN